MRGWDRRQPHNTGFAHAGTSRFYRTSSQVYRKPFASVKRITPRRAARWAGALPHSSPPQGVFPPYPT